MRSIGYGERAAGLSPNRRSLLEVLASIYAARLERAIRRDGPILLIKRQSSTDTFLKGKLDVTKWTASAVWQPHRFPIAFSALSVDHEFSQALVTTAQILASLSRSSDTQGRLRSAARALRPGYPEFAISFDPAALRPLLRGSSNRLLECLTVWPRRPIFEKQWMSTQGRTHSP
jgi:hypothetical protein